MKNEPNLSFLENKLDQLIDLASRMVPKKPPENSMEDSDAFVWQTNPEYLEPVYKVNRIPIDLLQGIEYNCNLVLGNTVKFAQGLPANNILLWGARGMGKSSLVKAVHAHVNELNSTSGKFSSIKLIEIHREDIESLPRLMRYLRESSHRFILFCDDLSFDVGDTSYKSLKAILDGGIEGRPGNVVFYATSNRRHLMPRDMVENEQSSAVNPKEAVEEKISLSDRFGLWVGFHNCSQEEYLTMVKSYVAHYRLTYNDEELRHEALEWSITRGARSGRVAFQFIQDLAGRLGKVLE